ncbi:DUF1705 domain-containing protein [Thiothrix subterranea]|uniref:DUF1705 domain-containing protein n=1 Tax=Thiothrix subterranea TaxID=2735563 RepID=UPI00280B7BD1|nr:DUF1705 domain-containing protein [Thiothrix subterranea]
MKFPWSPARLITVVALFVTVAYNQTLFAELHSRLNVFSWDAGGFVVTLFALMLALLGVPLLLLAQSVLLKPLLMSVVMLAAVLSYFTDSLGIVFDVDMIRNTAETVRDNNQQEARELLSLPLILHVLLWGVAPSIVIALIPMKRHQRWWHGAGIRTAYAVGLIVIATGLFVVNNKYATFFGRENAGLKCISPRCLHCIRAIATSTPYTQAKHNRLSPSAMMLANKKQPHAAPSALWWSAKRRVRITFP